MPELFALFIRPPVGAASYAGWSERIAFGADLPAELAEGGAVTSLVGHMQVDDPNAADVYAAVTGVLSTRPPSPLPTCESRPLRLDGTALAPSSPILYLTPTTAKLDPAYGQALAPLLPAGAHTRAERTDTAHAIDTLRWLEYGNLDPAEMKAALCPTVPTNKGRSTACKEKAWADFLAGKGEIHVRAGQKLGRAGAAYIPGSPANALQMWFGVMAEAGPHDPGFFYQAVEGSLLAADAPLAAAARSGPLGVHWPLILPGTATNAIGADRLLPYTALLQARNDQDLTYEQWRAAGDRQKALYLAQLLMRRRPDLALDGVRRFVFNMRDFYNVFQLEAVTEFFMNYPDPLKGDAAPVLPGDSGYRTVNLLAPYGAAAQVNGDTVTLDGAQNFTRIVAGRDVIVLDADTGRTHHQYRILAADPDLATVTVDAPPTVTAAGPWHISPRPSLVLVDPLGARVRGATAIRSAANTVTLEGVTDAQRKRLQQINPNFDTIALDDAAAGTRCDFLITKVTLPNAGDPQLTLDADPGLPVGGSRWAIPAGVGGLQGPVTPPSKKTARGWDHYDGMMFAVLGGSVAAAFPWTSYTSRKGGGSKSSSIRGNRFYHVCSFLSAKAAINVAFRVTDEPSMHYGRVTTKGVEVAGQPFAGRTYAEVDFNLAETLAEKGGYSRVAFFASGDDLFRKVPIAGVSAIKNRIYVSNANRSLVPDPPAGTWLFLYDGVHEAAHYFSVPVAPDTAPPDEIPSAKGKGLIRLHRGSTYSSTGSEGCQVSPEFCGLRGVLVDHHLNELADFYANRPESLEITRAALGTNAPPLSSRYKTVRQSIAAAEQQIRDIRAVIQDLASIVAGNTADETKVAQLQAVLDQALAPWKVNDTLGDQPTTDMLIVAIEEVIAAYEAGDVEQILTSYARPEDQFGARAIRALQETLERNKAESTRIQSYWNDRIQGGYWLIRPDELPVTD
jgi:hypothetical protein